ncbi:MAG: HEPN domain-containing protein [Cyanobacteriota bacterium]|nr:HEPN domain-containing protein [Cyanobacteriota bacterium]
MTPRAEAWLRQAQNDLEAARVTGQGGFHAQACYLAGQAAEKALKAAIVAAGITPPHSHSLERLVVMLREQGIATETLDALHLKALTRMNSETRYPQGDEAPADLFDANDTQQALLTAAQVVEAAAALLAG